MLLEEVRHQNNTERIFVRKLPIINYPLITTMTDEFDIEDSVARSILSYGLASAVVMKDNPQIGVFYREVYLRKLSTPTLGEFREITDCY